MADATLIDIAEAITKELNGAAAGTFDRGFTAVWSFGDWAIGLEDLNKLHVDVVPVSGRLTMLSKAKWLYTCSVEVGVRERFADDNIDQPTGKLNRDALKVLVRLTEQIGQYFAATSRRLADMTGAVWLPGGEGGGSGSDFRVWFVPEHLKELSQFTGIVRLVYGVPKTIA